MLTLRLRSVRSFVLRAGARRRGQQRALAELWPKYGIEFSHTTLDLHALFGRAAPRMLEIGFGAGEALLEFATAHPEIDCLGIEVHRPGVGHLLLGAEAATLRNVRVICHDAVEVLQHQLRARIDRVRAHFLSGSVAEEATSQAAPHSAAVRRVARASDRARRHAASRDGLGAVRAADARSHRCVTDVRQRRSGRWFRRAICRATAHSLRASRPSTRSRRMGSRIPKSELTLLSSTRARVVALLDALQKNSS